MSGWHCHRVGTALAVVLAGYTLASVAAGAFLARRLMAKGSLPRQRTALAAVLPRTRPERRLAVAVSLSAGVSEN
jgi:hypothetical protein